MTIRWVIGLLMAFVLLTLIGNIIEGADALTAAQVEHMQEMTEMQIVEAKDPDTGSGVTYGSNPLSVYDAVVSAVTMDWAWLYDLDYATTEAVCTAAGHKWNSDISACQTPNEFYIIWAAIYWPIMIGFLFMLFMTMLKLIRGGG